MFELTAANAEGYLRQSGRIGSSPATVTELAEGVSNIVLRVETPEGLFILKQSRPQLRTADPWFSDISRIWRERDFMRLLHPLLPPNIVPEVLWCDEANYAFAMTHAPQPFRNWRTVLLDGEVTPSLGETAGQLLGAIHERTAGIDLRAFDDQTIFEQLRVEPFYLRLQRRLPQWAERLQSLIDRARGVRQCLCHGDFSPKNLLLHAGGFTLVDYETGHHGDPAFDLGFFLSHLLLKAIHLPERRDAIFDLTRSFWSAYSAEVRFAPLDELRSATIGHLAGCMLARIDGASPAPYLTDPAKRDTARRLAGELFRQSPREWDEVIAIMR
jgi:5-methylthioribose kinase